LASGSITATKIRIAETSADRIKAYRRGYPSTYRTEDKN
jgi:hypothetical protein